jgi:hypothetical protein
MFILFWEVMGNWRSSVTATLDIDVDYSTLLLQFGPYNIEHNII